MRILFCNYEYPPLGGGGGVVNALLAQELAKQHEVTVLTSCALGLPPENIERGVRIVRVPVLFRHQEAVASVTSMLMFILMGLRVGKKLMAREHYDVINTHFVLPSGPVGAALARFAGVPNVLSVHGGDLYDPSKSLSPHQCFPLRLWIRWLLRRSDIVIGQSKNTLDNMRRYYTPEIEGVRVPLGIKKFLISPMSRSLYGFAQDQTLLVTVGRLIARKAICELIKVVDMLRHEPVQLLVVGSGPQEILLKNMARERGLEHRVFFVGHVEESEKLRMLQMSDVYVSASQHEGFGLVFLEAMASGLPIVCYNQGGQTDFLENGLTGYLLQLNDRNGFAASCRALMKDPALRQRMGQENVRRVNELYIERCAERYEEILQEAIRRCGLNRLVSLSTRKKLPLAVAEARLLQTGNLPTTASFLSLVNGNKQEEVLSQRGLRL